MWTIASIHSHTSVYMAFVWDLYNASLNSYLWRGIKNLFETTRRKFTICNILETSSTISLTVCLFYVIKALKTGCSPCVAGLWDFAFCSAQLSTLIYMGKYLSHYLFTSMTTCSSNMREDSTMSPEQSMNLHLQCALTVLPLQFLHFHNLILK